MNIPETLNIMGMPFRVEIVSDTLDAENAGSFNVEAQVISLADEAGPEFRVWLLLDQALSALDWNLDLGLKRDNEARLATGLGCLFRDSPGFLDFIASGGEADPPEKVIILGLPFTLQTVPVTLFSNKLGTCLVMKQRLRTAQGLGPGMSALIALHEAVHALDYLLGLNLKEEGVQRVASGVKSLLTENPDLVELLKGG